MSLAVTSESELAYHGPEFHIPGFPANPRMLLPRLYLQMGTWLDYYTGMHEPSLSTSLRSAVTSAGDGILGSHIPDEHKSLFPQLHVDSSWPPTYLAHGSMDTAVPVQESRNIARLLGSVGVDVVLKILEGEEHSLDKRPGADKTFGGPGELFDDVKDFLVKTLRPLRP